MRFSDIPGQEFVKQRLIRSVADNRVSHAQLFMGPEGSAKLALAIAYAQYINCRNRTAEDSCGVCPSCNKFTKLIHPDLHFLYPINKTKEVDDKKVYSIDFIVSWREFLKENNTIVSLPDWYDKIGIDKKQGLINAEDADGLNHTLAYKAYEAEYKVMIIWMAEKMGTVAANKLLKNLEEPPDKTLFLLICEDHEQLIATILSRTQLIKVPRMDDQALALEISEKYNLSAEQAGDIAWKAEGNLRLAMSMAEKISTEDEYDEEKEKFLLLRDWMRKVYIYSVKQKDYNQLLEVISRLLLDGSREKQKEFLSYSLGIFRNCMQYNAGNQQLVRFSGEEMEFISKFSTFIHARNIAFIEEEVNRAIFHIERNAGANLVLTDLSHILARLLKIPATAHTKKV